MCVECNAPTAAQGAQVVGHRHFTTAHIYDKRRRTTAESASHDMPIWASLKSGFGRSGNGFTVLIPRAENQIDYHTYNSFTLKHFPKPGSLPRAAKATK